MSEKIGLVESAAEHSDEDSKEANVNGKEDELTPSATKKQKTDNDDSKNVDDNSKNVDDNSKNVDDDSSKPAGAAAETNASKPPTTEILQVKTEELSANALVIFGLHPLAKKEEMLEVLEKFGKVERLEMRKAFASTYCFCDYETNQEAQTAIEKLHGTNLREKPLIVKLVNDKKAQSKPFSG